MTDERVDKFIFGVLILYAIGGAFFYGHEFGYMEGQAYQKYVDNKKLQQANQVIAGSLYEVQQ